MFLKNFKKKICPQKVEKTTLKSCSEFLKSTFFPLLPAQPKWPKQKKSYSKMWPIDQLYIELGQEYNPAPSMINKTSRHYGSDQE